MNKVYELNSAARRLLAFLHDWHLKAQGGPFSIGPCEETFQACSLDADAYRAAAGRLVTKDLAEWFGAGGSMTVTRYGIQVAEDEQLLDSELPVIARRMLALDLAPDVGESLAEVRQSALDFVSDQALQAILRRDLEELVSAVSAGLDKSVAMLAGSIMEAVLVDVIDRRPDLAQGYMGKKKFPSDASIDKLVEIAVAENLLDSLATSLVDSIKDYRDLIHPDRERRLRTKLDGATTASLLALLRLVLRSLHDARSQGRIDNYMAK